MDEDWIDEWAFFWIDAICTAFMASAAVAVVFGW